MNTIHSTTVHSRKLPSGCTHQLVYLSQIPTLVINSAHSAMHQSGNYSYFLSHSFSRHQKMLHRKALDTMILYYTLFIFHQCCSPLVDDPDTEDNVDTGLLCTDPAAFPALTSHRSWWHHSPQHQSSSDQSEASIRSWWPMRSRVSDSVRHS